MRSLSLLLFALFSLSQIAQASPCSFVSPKIKAEKNIIILPKISQLANNSQIYFFKNNTSHQMLIDRVNKDSNAGASAGCGYLN